MSKNPKELIKYSPLLGALLIIIGNVFSAVHGRYNLFSILLIIFGAALFILFFAKIDSRNFGHYLNQLLFCVFVIGSFILLYQIADNHQFSFDLTKNKAYSLSPQTIQYLSGLDKDIQIIAFTSDYRSTENFLNKYKKYSEHIKVQIYNPLRDVIIAKSVAQEIMGEIKDGDIVVKSEKRVKKTRGLTEDAITNAIVEVRRDKPIKAYFVVGHAEHPIESKLSAANRNSNEDKTDDSISLLVGKLEEKGVAVEELNLGRRGFVPDDASIIICAGPQVDFFPVEISALDEYLDKGGRAIFMLDPSSNQNETFANIIELLGKYGILLKDDIIVDINPVSMGMYKDPFSPLVSEYNSMHKITKSLTDFSSINFLVPTSRSVSPKEGLSAAYSVTPLIFSSETSWSEDIKKILRTKKVSEPEDRASIKKQSIAVAMVKDAPSGKEEDQTRIVVFGDSNIFTNDLIIQQIPAIIFYNTFHWIISQEDLVAIPPKTFFETPIMLSDTKSIWLYMTLVVLFPAMIIFGGLGYTYLRRKTR